jgi:hypothetical protein
MLGDMSGGAPRLLNLVDANVPSLRLTLTGTNYHASPSILCGIQCFEDAVAGGHSLSSTRKSIALVVRDHMDQPFADFAAEHQMDNLTLLLRGRTLSKCVGDFEFEVSLLRLARTMRDVRPVAVADSLKAAAGVLAFCRARRGTRVRIGPSESKGRDRVKATSNDHVSWYCARCWRLVENFSVSPPMRSMPRYGNCLCSVHRGGHRDPVTLTKFEECLRAVSALRDDGLMVLAKVQRYADRWLAYWLARHRMSDKVAASACLLAKGLTQAQAARQLAVSRQSISKALAQLDARSEKLALDFERHRLESTREQLNVFTKELRSCPGLARAFGVDHLLSVPGSVLQPTDMVGNMRAAHQAQALSVVDCRSLLIAFGTTAADPRSRVAKPNAVTPRQTAPDPALRRDLLHEDGYTASASASTCAR